MVEENELEVDVALLGGVGDELPAVEGGFGELLGVSFDPGWVFIIPMVRPDASPVDAVCFHAFEGFREIGDVVGSPCEIETEGPIGLSVIEDEFLVGGFAEESFIERFGEGEGDFCGGGFSVVGDDAEVFSFFGGGEVNVPFPLGEIGETGD